MSGVLITELNEDISNTIVESKNGGDRQYFIEGIFMQAGIKNRNGRRYNPKTLNEEVQRYIEEKVNTSSAIGELGHPATPALNHERASHLITSLLTEGNNFIGKAKILTSLPMGKIVKGLIDEGVRFGVSSRGVGILKKNNSENITEVFNYKLATAADIVSDPSGPNCWVSGVMENASWVYDEDNKIWLESPLLEETVKELDKPSRLVSEQTKLRLFEQFLNSIVK